MPSNVYVPLPLQRTSYRRRIPLGLLQRLYTDGIIWKRLQHPNIVSFLGFGSEFPPISLVYPWMPNGNLSNYVRERPNVDKLGLVRVCTRHGRQLLECLLPSILVIGGCSWIDLLAPVQSGSRELDRSKA